MVVEKIQCVAENFKPPAAPSASPLKYRSGVNCEGRN